jgi:hypothetical protein
MIWNNKIDSYIPKLLLLTSEYLRQNLDPDSSLATKYLTHNSSHVVPNNSSKNIPLEEIDAEVNNSFCLFFYYLN